MQIPLSPPALEELLQEVPKDRFAIALSRGKPLVGGRYLHWDALRHRKPPGDLTHREWWLGTKLARESAAETLPLTDKEGRAFRIVYVPPVRRGLHSIDQSFGRTGPSGDVRAMADAHGRKFLLTNSLMEEAIRSSQLEGASTTRARARDMIRERRAPKTKSERMILNNFQAMEMLEGLAESPLTLDAIFELHSILMDGTLDNPAKAGAFRVAEDNVVVELLNSVETAHVPPNAKELPERMDRILSFANGETPEDWLHPVMRSVIVHFMIGYDHPFVDGNGRVARALFYWSMLRHGYPLTRYLSISRILREAPAQYARAYLHTETDFGDLTYFVDHQIGVLIRSIDALRTYVEGKTADLREVEERVRRRHDLNHRQIALIGHALRHPGFEYTVKSHMNSHRVVTNTARSDLLALVDKDLLLRSKRGRAQTFIAPRDLDGRLNRLDES